MALFVSCWMPSALAMRRKSSIDSLQSKKKKKLKLSTYTESRVARFQITVQVFLFMRESQRGCIGSFDVPVASSPKISVSRIDLHLFGS